MSKRNLLLGSTAAMLWLSATPLFLFAQIITTDIINDNINWQVRATQTVWTAGTTDILDPDATPVFGNVPEHEPSFLISAAASDDSSPDQVNAGNICIQWEGVPPTTNNINRLIKTQLNTPYSGIDVDYRSWEDDAGDRCSVDSGDDNFNRVQKYYNNNIGNPNGGIWSLVSESFGNGASSEILYYWHYANGNTLGNPLDFGTIDGSESHVNQTSVAPSGISDPDDFQYSSNYSEANNQPSRDVVYQFTIDEPLIVTISTNNPATNFDTYIHLLDPFDDHITSNNNTGGTTRSAITRSPLCAGTYKVVVEGNGSASGIFELSISTGLIPPFNGGEIEEPANTVLEQGATLPTLNNLSPAGTVIDVSYQWEVNQDNGGWVPIAGKTGTNLSNYGNFSGCSMSFRRKVFSCGEAIVQYSNTVTFSADLTSPGGVIESAGQLSGCPGFPIPPINSVEPAGATGNVFRWEVNTGSGWTTIGGQTGPDLPGIGSFSTTDRRIRRVSPICLQDYYSNELTFKAYPSAVSGSGRVYVNDNAGGNNDGSSWTHAYTDLQAAIDEALCTGADIWVAAGTYRPTVGISGLEEGRGNTFFLSLPLKLYGGFAGGETSLAQRDPANHPTILSGDLSNNDAPNLTGSALLTDASRSDNALHVVTIYQGGSDLLIDGFEITGGNYDNVSKGGGAIYNIGTGSDSSPDIRNCVFYNNASARLGGAVFNEAVQTTTDPTFTQCRFRNNWASVSGGAVANTADILNGTASSSPAFERCDFTGNGAGENGGAIFNDPGTDGISSPTITTCSFIGNTAAANGGAIENFGRDGESISLMINSIFINNVAQLRGGAIYNLVNTNADNTVILNCSFYNNIAQVQGGAIYNVSGNNDPVPLEITNSILWNNGLQENFPLRNSGFSLATITYSIFDDGTVDNAAPVLPARSSGSNNLDSDPLFLNPDAEDLRLTGVSPAVDAGNSSTPDLSGIAEDLAGKARITGSAVDMGAFENNCELFDPAIYVDIDAPAGGNGQSWATAFTDLQDAIDAARLCDKPIWVAEGTYYPSQRLSDLSAPPESLDSKKTFYIDRNIQLYGGFAGTESSLEERDYEQRVSILSGDLPGTDVHAQRVLTIDGTRGNAITNDCVIDGFSITGGYAQSGSPEGSGGSGIFNNGSESGAVCSPTIANCKLFGNHSQVGGGAILNSSRKGGESSPLIDNCMFFDNTGIYGGAIWNASANEGESAPVISNCFFENNTADLGGAIANYDDIDPGLVLGRVSAQISACTFINNLAVNYGGAIFHNADLGLMDLKLSQCTFVQNTADYGGAVYGDRPAEGSVQLIACRFSENEAAFTGGAVIFNGYGSGVFETVNCVFQNNTAGGTGGAIHHEITGGAPLLSLIMNSTFFNNTAVEGRAVSTYIPSLTGGETTIRNSILWNGQHEIYHDGDGATSLNHSLIDDGTPDGSVSLPAGVSGANNLDFEPRFSDPSNGDLRLTGYSPAINTGDNTAIPAGITTDVDGNARIANAVVDMGAFENETFTATVTFRVDMSEQSVAPEGVHVAGNFQFLAGFGDDWDPATTKMTDPNNDQIYEVTVTLAGVTLGSPFEYKFINGNVWGPDESVPADCAVSDLNRQFYLESTAQSLPVVCFGKCLACKDDCTLVLDFEQAATTTDFQYFANDYLNGQLVAIGSNPAPDPVNNTATVMGFTKTASALSFAGAFSNPDPSQPLDFTTAGQVCVKVLMDHPGNLTLKLEASPSGGSNWIQTVENNTLNQWVELCFDVAQPSLEAPFEPATGQVYERLTLFPDFGTLGTGSDVITYLDEVIVCTSRGVARPGLCATEPLLLGSGSLASGTYSSKISLTSSNTIEADKPVTFTAVQTIRLLPGFSTEANAEFTARIADCDNAPELLQPEAVEAVTEVNPTDRQRGLSVYPNPSRSLVNIGFDLPESSYATLEVYHGTGLLMKRILETIRLEPGEYTRQLSIASFESGIYFIVLRTSGRILKKKLIVLD